MTALSADCSCNTTHHSPLSLLGKCQLFSIQQIHYYLLLICTTQIDSSQKPGATVSRTIQRV